jgi:hypothetical protein
MPVRSGLRLRSVRRVRFASPRPRPRYRGAPEGAGGRRARKAVVLVPIALALLLTTSAQAYVPFQNGDTLDAGQLDANFMELIEDVNELKAHTIEVNTVQYSTNAVYVGGTQPTTARITHAVAPVGYQAAKAQCEDAFGPSAHMCTGDEMARSAQLGLFPLSEGWFASGSMSGGGTNYWTGDCLGWTFEAAECQTGIQCVGQTWRSDGIRPQYTSCSEEIPILCCDNP